MPFFQSLSTSYPPVPSFTPSSLLDLSSKVYIITNCALPFNVSLAKILYNLHATVYIGASSLRAYNNVTSQLKTSCPDSKGRLKPFLFDPTDPKTIKHVVSAFLEQEWRLDVLFLDTKSEELPRDSSTPLSNNNLLPSYLLAKLFLPMMHTTASHFCHPNPSIRVIWISNTNTTSADRETNLSTADTFYLLAHESANRKIEQVDNAHTRTLPNSNPSGVQHVFVDQHVAGSNLGLSMRRFMGTGARHNEYEACTLLHAGLAPDVRSGDWVIPYGRKGTVPDHVRRSIDTPGAEGRSASARIYEQCEEQARPYI